MAHVKRIFKNKTHIKIAHKIEYNSVKSLPAVQETQVRFLGWEDLLEKEMTTHSSILAWKMPWTEESGGLVCGVTRVGHK